MPKTLDELEKEIYALHAVLEARGINAKRTTDIFGRECAPCPASRARAAFDGKQASARESLQPSARVRRRAGLRGAACARLPSDSRPRLAFAGSSCR